MTPDPSLPPFADSPSSDSAHLPARWNTSSAAASTPPLLKSPRSSWHPAHLDHPDMAAPGDPPPQHP
uniref:Uncharacterized protein n=1 Tax=Arundo donax TaxID=35708 RepID=A0A0A9B6M4_ARUDO